MRMSPSASMASLRVPSAAFPAGRSGNCPLFGIEKKASNLPNQLLLHAANPVVRPPALSTNRVVSRYVNFN